jgi:hypothetical protein
MKKLIFGLIATAIFSFTSFAQERIIISGKISTNSFSLDIPLEVKSNLKYQVDSYEFTITERYIENLKGYVTIITDSKNNVVAVTLPPATTFERARSIGKCFTTGFWSNEGGTGWPGFWNCLVN